MTSAAARESVAPVTVSVAREVRGTLIVSSLQMLRGRGLIDRYLQFLDPALHGRMRGVTAATWVPVELIVAHYTACNQLDFTVAELIEVGRELTSRLHRPVLDIILRLAGAAGVTPWALAPQLPRIWERMYRGGSIEATPLGPKDARVDSAGREDPGYSAASWETSWARGRRGDAPPASSPAWPRVVDSRMIPEGEG